MRDLPLIQSNPVLPGAQYVFDYADPLVAGDAPVIHEAELIHAALSDVVAPTPVNLH